MKIAIFSDVHGNRYALEAVLAAIRREHGCDAVVAAGDLCLGGSDPGGCVDLLRSAGASCVYGNTELYLRAPDKEPPDEPHRSRWSQIQPAVYWTLERLSAAQQGWLAQLPFSLQYSPTGQPEDDLLVVHANPRDVELNLYPAPDEQVGLWGAVRQPDDDPVLVRALAETRAQTIAFGHFHYVFLRHWRQYRLVCVAGCSLPGVDHDRRARYTLFTWNEKQWTIERRWVDYSAEREITALRASDNPSRDFFLRYFG